jgi:hypothetical protein
MGNVPEVNGNTYDLHIKCNGDSYVKIGDQVITDKISEVRLFLMAYRMGRNHKKNEIRNALDI